MKQKFADYMLDKNFKGAAELIFESTLKIQIPDNVNLNLNIDRNKNIADLEVQMKNCYNEINDTYSAISFEKTWANVINSKELQENQSIKNNELPITIANKAFNKTMDLIKKQQYEQIFDTTVLTLNAALQGIINAAVELK